MGLWYASASSPVWRINLHPERSVREDHMGRYIALLNWTDQGIKSVKDSPNRLDAGRALGKKLGVELREFYLTTGASDMVVICDAPDDATMAKFNLTLGMGGNVRTTTLKAFSEDEYRKIIGGL
jgi:uncharacterized protein with GYD domain